MSYAGWPLLHHWNFEISAVEIKWQNLTGKVRVTGVMSKPLKTYTEIFLDEKLFWVFLGGRGGGGRIRLPFLVMLRAQIIIVMMTNCKKWSTELQTKVGVGKVAPWQCARSEKFKNKHSLIVIEQFISFELEPTLNRLKTQAWSEISSLRLVLSHPYFSHRDHCRRF